MEKKKQAKTEIEIPEGAILHDDCFDVLAFDNSVRTILFADGYSAFEIKTKSWSRSTFSTSSVGYDDISMTQALYACAFIFAQQYAELMLDKSETFCNLKDDKLIESVSA